MNLLLTIRSLFRREGTDEAARSLKTLKDQSSQIEMPRQMLSGSNGRNASDTADGVGKMDRANRKATESTVELNKAARGTSQTLLALKQVASGDIFGALRTATTAMTEKFAELGIKVGAVLGAFTVGWQVGSLIRDLTGLGKILDRLVVPPPVIAKSIRDMSAQKLAGLQAELDGARERLEKLQKAAEVASARIGSVIAAQAADVSKEGSIAEQNAGPDQRELISAQTKLRLAAIAKQSADEKKAVQEKNATLTQMELYALRDRLAAAQDEAQRLHSPELAPNANQSEEERTKTLSKIYEADQTVVALQNQLTKLVDEEQESKRRVLDAQTALTTAVTEEIVAQTALSDILKRNEELRIKGSLKAAGDAYTAEAESRKDREKAQFEVETPERKLNYLRNQANAVMGEMRGGQGPVNQARMNELIAEYYRLKKQAQDIEDSEKAKKDEASRKEAEQIERAKAAASEKAKQAKPVISVMSVVDLFELAPTARTEGRTLSTRLEGKGLPSRLEDRYGKIPKATPSQESTKDPASDIAKNTEDAKRILERIEKALQPPRK